MIDLPVTQGCPPDADWSRTRTYWACPRFGDYDDSSPVAVRAEGERVIRAEFERAFALTAGARRVWLGDPVRDHVDWMDGRVWYPIRAEYDHDPPEQQPRPYRLSPLLRHDPGYEDAYTLFDRGLALLAAGDFEAGWPLYEFRWGTQQGRDQSMVLEMPHWDGVAPGRLLIHAEQGAGDTIHFSRFLRHVPANVDADFLVPGEMAELMRTVTFPGKVVSDTVQEYDFHLPLCSLPLALGMDVTRPCEPYLCADRVRMIRWHKRLMDLGKYDNVGICWAGSPTHPKNILRTQTIESFEPILRTPGWRLFSLQKGPPREQLKYLPDDIEVIDWTDDLKDWSDTAAFVSNLDLVVTVDTGVAHLAGALGVPVRLVIPGEMEWRWRCGVTWYPSLAVQNGSGIERDALHPVHTS